MTTPKTSSRKSSSRPPKDAIALLRADHAKVQDLFEQFEKTRSEEKKQSLATEICTELKVHAAIEEEIFYPAARAAIDDNDLLDEATVEHQSAKDLISQIEAGSPDDDMWSAKVTVLGEYIKHHVKEEQNELFAEVRKTDMDLKDLGAQMLARKQELMASMENGDADRAKENRGRTSKSDERSHGL